MNKVISYLVAFAVLMLGGQTVVAHNSKDYQYYSTVRSLLNVKDVAPKHGKTYKWARFGRDFDGGYVVFDDFNKDSIAYSFGVSDDDSWKET